MTQREELEALVDSYVALDSLYAGEYPSEAAEAAFHRIVDRMAELTEMGLNDSHDDIANAAQEMLGVPELERYC